MALQPQNSLILGIAKNRARQAFFIGGSLSVILSLLFLFFPEIDLAVSEVFFRREKSVNGELVGFWLREEPALELMFFLVDVIARVILLGLIVLLGIRLLRRHHQSLSTAIVTLSLILGPVLLVNTGLKDHWDRARPREIQYFGGESKFSPAWIISDQCKTNCSFTSGHAAAGFSILVLHFVRVSVFWIWLGMATGFFIGLARVAVGAHFLSDVVFSFFAVYLSAAVVAWAFASFYRGISPTK